MKSIYDKIRTLEITTSRKVAGLFAGNYRSSFKGSGIEVDDIRPYIYGDNAKNIDWTTTAKLGEPYVKTFAETRELATFIIIDVSASMLFSSQKSVRKSDIAVEAAATLMFSALKNNEAVGAILFGGTQQVFIPAKKGKRHVLYILKTIMEAYENTERGDTSSTFADALKYFNTTVKKHPICFAITDTDVIEGNAERALQIANIKNDFVYIHVSDPFEHTITDTNNISLRNMESGMKSFFMLSSKKVQNTYQVLRQEKEEKRTEILQKSNIDFLPLSTTSKVYPALFHFFKRRQQRRA